MSKKSKFGHSKVDVRLPFIGLNIPFIGASAPHVGPSVGLTHPSVTFKPNRGFTLVEMIVTLAVAGILFSFAIPNFRELILNNRLKGDTTELVHSLVLARSEAVKRKRNIRVCHRRAYTNAQPDPACLDPVAAIDNSWVNGFVIWVDDNGDDTYSHTADDSTDTLIRDIQRLSPNIYIQARKGGVVIRDAIFTPRGIGIAYTSGGNIDSSFATTISFLVCDQEREGESGRTIDINRTGRTKVDPQTCPANP